jgi:transcriptional antiterminator RfaH
VPGEISNRRILRWYLVHTRPACERVAQVNLERQGYGVYYPRLLQPVRARGRWVERLVSLFPRYVFLQLEVGRQPLAPAQSTVGVTTVVRFGFDYAVVPNKVVEDLRARADPATGVHHLGLHKKPFAPGSKVRIVAGAFDGLGGVFQRQSGDDRVIVLLKLLGQDTPVCVPGGFVMPDSKNVAELSVSAAM